MCKELKTEVLVNYLLSAHSEISLRRVNELARVLSEKIEGLLVDDSWFSILKLQQENADLFYFKTGSDGIILCCTDGQKSNMHNQKFLDFCYARDFSKKDFSIIRNVLTTNT